MKILFMGTAEYAAAALAALAAAGCDIRAVISQPDKPQGRHMRIEPTPVKALALSLGIETHAPDNIKNGALTPLLESIVPELIVLCAYGRLLPEYVLDYPKYGSVNLHGSRLPAYRGAAPVQMALINGDTETGNTTQYMAPELDSGDIIHMSRVEIYDNDTQTTLFARMMEDGAALIVKTVRAIAAGNAPRVPQNHSKATRAPMLDRSMSPVDFTRPARAVSCQIRGLNPWPSATAVIAGETLKLHMAAVADAGPIPGIPGEVIEAGADGVVVACGAGAVSITELQAPGGKRLGAAAFLNGRKIEKGMRFG